MWLLIVVLIGVVVHGWIIRPAAPRAGTGLSVDTGLVDDQPRRTFRVAAFNIQSARGTDGQTDIHRTARLLGSFDLIALNEVRGKFLRTPDNQAAILGDLLDAPWMFAPSERRFWHDSFGNGFISRLPVEFYLTSPLPTTQWSGFRNIVHARVMLDGVSLNVLVVHIDRDRERQQQFRIVRELFLAMQEPAVLLGDLNTRADDPLMVDLLQTAGVSDPIGDTDAPAAKERVDWILTRGLSRLEAGALQTQASDHPLIWAQLTLPPGPVEAPRHAPPPTTVPSAPGPTTAPATSPTTRNSAPSPR